MRSLDGVNAFSLFVLYNWAANQVESGGKPWTAWVLTTANEKQRKAVNSSVTREMWAKWTANVVGQLFLLVADPTLS